MCPRGQPKPLTPAVQLKREPFIHVTGALLLKETPIRFVAMALFHRDVDLDGAYLAGRNW